MDAAWGAAQLGLFIEKIEKLRTYQGKYHQEAFGQLPTLEKDYRALQDELLKLDPVARIIIGSTPGAHKPDYVINVQNIGGGFGWAAARRAALNAIGLLTLGAEARKRMQPDAPELPADRFHPWVWEAARPLWESGSPQEAVHVAARSVNARIQQKLGRTDIGETQLAREAFTRNDPEPGKPRLRFPGDRGSDTWRSRQDGARDFAAGCFLGIRNPAVHEHDQVAESNESLEQLAALSLLARWVDACAVERI